MGVVLLLLVVGGGIATLLVAAVLHYHEIRSRMTLRTGSNAWRDPASRPARRALSGPAQVVFIAADAPWLRVDCTVSPRHDNARWSPPGLPVTFTLCRPRSPDLAVFSEDLLRRWANEAALLELAFVRGATGPLARFRHNDTVLQLDVAEPGFAPSDRSSTS